MKNLVLSIAVYLAATLITFSQTENPPTEKAGTPLTLPADNVALVDIDGRIINATVLSIAADNLSIVIRTKDGADIPILMSRLNPATIQKLTGGRPAPVQVTRPAPVKPLEVREKEMMKAAALMANQNEEYKKFKKLPAKEAAELLAGNTEMAKTIQSAITYEAKYNWDQITWRYSNFMMPMDILSQLNLPSPQEEVVSLRPVFEKAGIKAMQQGKKDCTTYAGMYLAQYWQAKNGKKVMNRDEFLAALKQAGKDTPNYVLFPDELLRGFKQIYGKTPNVLVTSANNTALSTELIKEMLRKGRPVIVHVSRSWGNQSMSHALLCVGFTTKDGKTSFQCIDSNNLNVDNGYCTEFSPTRGMCIWIE